MVNLTESAHPSDARLLATIHAEPGDVVTATRAHVRACVQCAARQQTLIDDDVTIGGLLAELDDPPRAVQPRFAHEARRRWVRRGLRTAAAAAATLAVAAAAMVVPGSPVHRWISRAVVVPVQEPHSGAAAPVPVATSGIAVPASRSLVIVFRREQLHGTVEIIRTATGDVTFRSRGGNAAYQVASGQVSIDNEVPADAYQIEVPRSVQQLQILVGARVLLRWPEDSARRAPATQPDRFHIPLDIGDPHAQ